jgi:preprotein translocase subunit SecG
MQSVLIVIHLLVVIALIAVVLLQRSEGGALGTGGGGGFMTGRGQANALSRATAILGALYFATALLMSAIAGWNRAPRSIIDSVPASTSGQTTPAKPTAPAAPAGHILDQLKGGDTTPAAPSTDAPK